MTLTDNDLAKAQAGDAAGMQRIFAEALPECARIAASLLGSTASSARVLKTLVDRAPDQLQIARDGDEASRWFVHQTLLLTRERSQPSTLFQDALLNGVGGPDVVQYQAMIAGLRKLSRQQQEAFILHHAQHWNIRFCSIAMDCSTEAVQTHLDEATRALSALVGQHLPALIKAMEQVHKTQPIELPQSPQRAASLIQRRRSWRFSLRLLGWVAIVAFIVLVAAAVVYIVPRVKI